MAESSETPGIDPSLDDWMGTETNSVAETKLMVSTAMGIVIVTSDFLGILEYLVNNNHSDRMGFTDADDGAYFKGTQVWCRHQYLNIQFLLSTVAGTDLKPQYF